MASHLGQPVELVKKWTTSSNFVKWSVYLDRLKDEVKPEYFYWAQIAAEIRRSYLKASAAKAVTTGDFLKPYKRVRAGTKKEDDKSWKKKMNEAKGFFYNLAGISSEDN